ncbi:VOC family protein [Streptomyces macrosporus]|uniref:VOC domain-containing protein n=1 Tax=Streptomyces macrosporus TaxID=44032 RepID=A0ABN3JB77_9ACTN
MADAGTAFAEGTPCWTDAMLPDLEAGKRFYGELFGWTYGDPAPPERGAYTVARLDGDRAAALSHKPDGRLPTAWTLYFATSDAQATAERIRAAGGQLVTEPAPVGRAGVVATAVDPGGAAFGLWQPGTLTGFEVTRKPGSYVWTEVCTREKAAVDAFYAEVFGFGMYPAGGGGAGTAPEVGEAEDAARERAGAAEAVETVEVAEAEIPGEPEPGTEPGAEAAESREAAGAEETREGISDASSDAASGAASDIMVWVPAGAPADDEHAIGSRTMIDDTYPVEMPAHFLVYFAVADCDAAVRTTTRLGGRTVEGPQDTPFGRYAILVDNQGARFGVLDTSTAS